MPSETPLEIRKAWAELRQILYEPSAVWLATWAGTERWLTDQFVMLDVTGSDALAEAELPDGGYKLTAANGFQPRDTVPEPDLDVYFAAMDVAANWHLARPTEWSVAEHPGKAMLWTYFVPIDSGFGTTNVPLDVGQPCLLGESTWTAIRRHHPGCLVEYSDEINAFRFAELPRDCPSCAGEPGVYCGHRPLPFCFAAGIRIPDGQEQVAAAIACTV